MKTSKIEDLPDGIVKKNLEDLHDLIKRVLPNVPFLIAGGSVFSAVMNNDKYYDIDLFFSSEDDFLKAEEVLNNIIQEPNIKQSMVFMHRGTSRHETRNSVTFSNLLQDKVIQIVKKNFGTPEEIFAGFDLYNSMIGITHDGLFLYDENVSSEIKINYKALNLRTFERHEKYTGMKGAKDLDGKSLEELFDYCMRNLFQKIRNAYLNELDNYCHDIIRLMTANSFYTDRKSKFSFQKIHDRIVESYEDDKRIDLMQILIPFREKIESPADEFLLHQISMFERPGIIAYSIGGDDKIESKEVQLKRFHSDGSYSRIKNKYPEYFI